MCLLSFAAFLRFDEMSKLNCSDVKLYKDRMVLTIHESKTDQYRQWDEVLVAATGTETCPVKMVRRYVELGSLDLCSQQPFFCGIIVTKRGQTLRRHGWLSYTWSRELICEALQKVSLDVCRCIDCIAFVQVVLQQLPTLVYQIEPSRNMADGNLRAQRTDM